MQQGRFLTRMTVLAYKNAISQFSAVFWAAVYAEVGIQLTPAISAYAQDYNVLFAEQDGSRSTAQIQAFDDTWKWGQEAELTYTEMVESGEQVSFAMQAFRTVLGESEMLAYLAMMAPRLVEFPRRPYLQATWTVGGNGR
jgi:hypothetical protein